MSLMFICNKCKKVIDLLRVGVIGMGPLKDARLYCETCARKGAS